MRKKLKESVVLKTDFRVCKEIVRKEKYSKEWKRVKWNLGNYIVIVIVFNF